jgi:glycosyltransferase involved in cell wall biosynthesis
MRVLGFGTYDTSRHPRVGIILDGLRAHGDEVVEANVPLALSTAERVAMVRRPWLGYRLVLQLGRTWGQLVARVIRSRRFHHGRPFDAIVVGYLGQFDVLLARLLFPRRLIVLDQLVFGADTAADRELGRSGGIRHRLLRQLDSAAVAAADIVLVDTDENRELLAPDRRHKAVVAAVGAPDDWFRAGKDRPVRTAESAPELAGPLRVVFFGLFTPLQGVNVIAAALSLLASRSDIQVTMIGTGQQHESARRLAAPNQHVRWLDWVPALELARLVATFDVCLGIFGTGPKALRVVPNKVFQGAAAGCAIVTSETAPQRRAMMDDALFVPAGDPHALADALRHLADHRDAAAKLGDQARSRAVATFSASSVVQALHDRLITSLEENS